MTTMQELKGTVLAESPVAGLRHVGTLEEFDGILLAYCCQAETGQYYLQYWADCDARRHRWMFARVPKEAIEQLKQDLSKLYAVLSSQILDDFVFYVDQQNGKAVQIMQVAVKDIPEDYLPKRS